MIQCEWHVGSSISSGFAYLVLNTSAENFSSATLSGHALLPPCGFGQGEFKGVVFLGALRLNCCDGWATGGNFGAAFGMVIPS
ncbi:hypothetical protein WL65_22980 [Burkholderia ubonensis]|nr:hypothetical protein WL65_22980 [Burkholderia ubonensis]